MSHQTENGGFKTYIENNLRKSERFSGEISLDGWCSECIDVTINAINTLDKFEEYDLSKVKAEKYLEDKVKENDIHSYWWESDIPMKIGAIKSDTGKIIELYEMQDNNMSHYIRAMFLSALDDSNIKLRKNLAEKLIYSQRQDGSWESGAILRFPHPSNEEPWNNDLMWRDPGKEPLWRLYPCMGDIFNYYSPLYFFTNSMILDPGNLPLYFFMVSPIKAAEFRLGCLDIRLTMNDINSSSFVLYIEKSIVLPFAYSTMISIIASFARSPEFNFANILSASSLNLSNSTSISRLNLVFTSFGVETKISAIVTGFT